jgi:hypothetical protein
MLAQSVLSLPSGDYTLRVVNPLGTTVYHESGLGPGTRDFSFLGSGMHIVAVEQGDGTTIRSFLKIR